jgi:hypothetical protein
MGMIGNAEDAEFIRDWYREEASRQEWGYNFHSGAAPEGWRLLGEGCYRTVFASPDGVAYKVEMQPSEGSEDYEGCQSNWSEHENLRRLYLECKMPKGARLPRHTLYVLEGEAVMAMELVTGSTLSHYSRHRSPGEGYWSLRRVIQDRTGIEDMHGGNIMVDENTNELVPVDLGW